MRVRHPCGGKRSGLPGDAARPGNPPGPFPAEMPEVSPILCPHPHPEAAGNWVRRGLRTGMLLPASLSRAGEGPRTPATSWAGNLHHTLGCADAAVRFRKELGSGCSGGTQVGLPPSCQSTRSLGGLLGTLRAGPLHGRRDRPASRGALRASGWTGN